jgi:17beta-estradiol 17-dehydrogenase / very-long-chain 3-oxoacyl-CoA reductase
MSLFDLLVIFLGLYVLVPKLYGVYIVIKQSHFMKQKYIGGTYNNGDSWVLVTGCTSGIGEEIAHRFAKLGFNIILVSRSLERLNNVAKAIKDHSPDVKTKVVVADFANGGEDIAMYDKIYN